MKQTSTITRALAARQEAKTEQQKADCAKFLKEAVHLK